MHIAKALYLMLTTYLQLAVPQPTKTCGLLLLLYFGLSVAQITYGHDLIVNVGELNPAHTENLENIYVDVVKAAGKYYKEGNITIRTRPFSRSVREVSQGSADLHLPLICPRDRTPSQHFQYGKELIHTILFAIYSHKNNPITREDLLQAKYSLNAKTLRMIDPVYFSPKERQALENINADYPSSDEMVQAASTALHRTLTDSEQQALAAATFPYRLETERLHRQLLDVPTYPAISADSGLRKVISRRIDGYIFAIATVEELIQEENLPDEFARSVYFNFDVCFVVAQGSNGDHMNRAFSQALRELKTNKEYYRHLLAHYRNVDTKWLKDYGNPMKKAKQSAANP